MPSNAGLNSSQSIYLNETGKIKELPVENYRQLRKVALLRAGFRTALQPHLPGIF